MQDCLVSLSQWLSRLTVRWVEMIFMWARIISFIHWVLICDLFYSVDAVVFWLHLKLRLWIVYIYRGACAFTINWRTAHGYKCFLYDLCMYTDSVTRTWFIDNVCNVNSLCFAFYACLAARVYWKPFFTFSRACVAHKDIDKWKRRTTTANCS